MKLFIWDFHGVLEKDNDKTVLEITNLVLKRNGYSRKLSAKENEKLYGKKWFQYFEYLLPTESHQVHIKLQQNCLEIEEIEPERMSKHIKTNDYVFETLEPISKKHHQILISNCNPVMLTNFVLLTKIDKYFKEKNTFSTNSHLFPEKITKKALLDDYLKYSPKYDQLITIGDSPSDMEILGKNKGQRYLYSHPGKKFRDCESDFKIHDLRKILQEI